jgi:hypothetical protein
MAEYTARAADLVLSKRIAHHAAILIVGPRAVGKSTTAGRFAKTTIRLDQPSQAVAVRADPDGALRERTEPILLDEWQAVPEVLAAVKRSVDEDPRPGRFLVTGSVRAEFDASTWPGTGRLIHVPMYGLTVAEILGRTRELPLLELLSRGTLEPLLDTPSVAADLREYLKWALRGGFPEPALRLPPTERPIWLESYVDQLLARDVTARVGRRDLRRLRRFAEVCALNSAGVVSSQSLYEAAGISKATGESYDELLRSLSLVDMLPAWWTNRLKRLARAPKRFFVDPSLALGLLRADIDAVLADGDLLGRTLETFVVAQLRAQLPACASAPTLHHFRDAAGRHEVDVIVEYGGGRIFAFEVKATSAPKPDDARHLTWLADALEDRFLGGAVLHTGPSPFMLSEKIVASPIANLWG